MNKNLTIGIIVVALLVLVVGLIVINSNKSLGGITHNTLEQFVSGVVVGSSESPACIKVQDTDKGGWSYITYLNGTETVTGGSAAALAAQEWSIPSACTGK